MAATKVVLYGIRYDLNLRGVDGGFEEDEVRNALATFDDEKLAKEYIRASKLKTYSDYNRTTAWTFSYRNKQFKAKSLLGYYTDAEIEPYEDPCLPHNPAKP